MIKRKGIIPAVEGVVCRKEVTSAFEALQEMGMIDFAFEAVVCRHPGVFSQDAVRRSKERLDSWADAALYAALIFGVVVIYNDVLRVELSWVLLALGSYLASTLAGFWKYQRWPSYHTRAAKTSWLLTAVAVIALFTDWSIWPLRIAALAVTLTNLEALAITAISPQWRTDVTSIYHAWRDNRHDA